MDFFKIIKMCCLLMIFLGINLFTPKLSFSKPQHTNFNFAYFFKTSIFTSNEKESFIEGSSGIKLQSGVNFYNLVGVNLKSKKLDFLMSVRQKSLGLFESDSKSKNEIELFKNYLKFYFYKFSFEIGKDNVQYEPGEYGLLFSYNVPPYWMVKLQTEKPLNFLGKWNFACFQGWLKEERKDYSDPKVLGIRISWKPVSWLEIGGTRSTLFGGEGRPNYTSPWDYWEIIIASKENIPGNKYDNDAYAAYDISLYLPLNKIFDSIKTFKVYYEDGGTDLCAFWQPEDTYSECGILGFSLMNHATVAGILMQTNSHLIRIEYAETSPDWYIHHVYNYEGYTYQGLCLGYPYGRNIQSFSLNHKITLSPLWKLSYKLGYYRTPYKKTAISMKVYYQEFKLNFSQKKWGLGVFLKLSETQNYDKAFLPTQFSIEKENKNFYIIGISFQYNWGQEK